MDLKRGEIYFINFPYTFDEKYPNGKSKFVLILQEGSQFQKFDTVEILLITSNEDSTNYGSTVEIDLGTTDLDKTSWIVCAQPYPILKTLFEGDKVWCAGKLSEEKMLEVDEEIYNGLCMKLKQELENEEPKVNFFLGALVGGIIGAGIVAYIKNREKNETALLPDFNVIDETEDDEDIDSSCNPVQNSLE